jgi:signal transduction histidine kinase
LRDQEQALKDGRPMLVEDRLQLPSGRVVYYLRHIMPLPDFEDQNKSQILVMFIDLTEKYLAEQRERELALAQERNLFLTEFFSILSHDLKTPLTTITTSLYLLERVQTPQQRAEKTKQIDEQIQLMDTYIQDMLMISRLEHLPLVKFEMLDLNALVDEVVELMLLRIEGRHLYAQIDLQPDLPPIRGEIEQLRRMLINLIENAINYSSQSGQIMVKTYTVAGRVTLEVTDSGIGIEPDALPHIFDRFFRTDSAKQFVHSGTGLGLAIVKKIADMHEANIEVSGKAGEGTTFHIYFSRTNTT